MRRHIIAALLLTAACAAGLLAWQSRQNSFTADGLAAYAATVRLDPLFAIEGTDPTALQHAVQEFLAIYDQVLARYPQKERASLTSLYPTDFLKLLPKLETARQDLLRAPTAASVRSYHDILVKTMRAYAADARATSALIQSTAAEYPRTGYIAGSVVPADLAQKLNAVGEYTLSVQIPKEEARFACVRNAELCPQLHALLASRRDMVPTPPKPAPAANSTAKVAAVTQTLNSLHRSYARTEPALLAIESTCVASSTTAYVQAYYLSNHHGPGRKLSYVNDAYFYDTTALHTKIPQRPIWGALLDAGVTWQYQNAGNAYECPDAGYDQTAVGSILGTLQWLRTNATTTGAQRILSLRTVSKADIAPYIQERAATDTPDTNALVERYIQGSSDFDQVVLGALNDNGFLLASTTVPSDMPSYTFVIATRNYASTLFLMGNPTFVPQPQSLFSSHTPQGLGAFFLRSYLDDLSKTTSDSALVSQYKRSLEIQFPTTP